MEVLFPKRQTRREAGTQSRGSGVGLDGRATEEGGAQLLVWEAASVEGLRYVLFVR